MLETPQILLKLFFKVRKLEISHLTFTIKEQHSKTRLQLCISNRILLNLKDNFSDAQQNKGSKESGSLF